jgi:hypothetical protein
MSLPVVRPEHAKRLLERPHSSLATQSVAGGVPGGALSKVFAALIFAVAVYRLVHRLAAT